jgi:2-dehydropantoate 2-reductase
MSSAVTVVGAGGIGGCIAAELAGAGTRVTVVDADRAHVDAVRRYGLLVRGVRGEYRVPVADAVVPDAWTEPAELVLLAVKSGDREAAVDVVADRVAPDGLVVVLQNGWNAARVADRVGASRTVAAMVHVVGTLDRPGEVTRHTDGTLHIGSAAEPGVARDRLVRLADLLSVAVDCSAVDDVWGYIWSKQVWGATMPVNALVDQPAADTYGHEWVQRILLAVIVEGMQAAAAAGIRLRPYERFDPTLFDLGAGRPWTAFRPLLPRGSAKGNSGVWRDIRVHHRPTEVPHLTGELVRIGRRHGLAMSVNARIAELVAGIESGDLEMGWPVLRELRPLAEEVLATLPGLDPRTHPSERAVGRSPAGDHDMQGDPP